MIADYFLLYSPSTKHDIGRPRHTTRHPRSCLLNVLFDNPPTRTCPVLRAGLHLLPRNGSRPLIRGAPRSGLRATITVASYGGPGHRSRWAYGCWGTRLVDRGLGPRLDPHVIVPFVPTRPSSHSCCTTRVSPTSPTLGWGLHSQAETTTNADGRQSVPTFIGNSTALLGSVQSRPAG